MATPESLRAVGAEKTNLDELLQALEVLRNELLRSERDGHVRLAEVHPEYRQSARNLLHYLALRSRDLRTLQTRLSNLGLSSLGRSEAHALASVEAVLNAVRSLAGLGANGASTQAATFAEGSRLLNAHTVALLGEARPERHVRIQVTLPGEAADDYSLLRSWIERGMDCVRINCAHDDAQTWQRMVTSLRRAEAATSRRCRVMMDLAGPKLRTGPVANGPAVLRVRPTRDAFGRVLQPARIWLTSSDEPSTAPSAADGILPVEAHWLAALSEGETVEFADARDAQRSMKIVRRVETGAWADLDRTAYFVPGLELTLGSSGKCGRVGALPDVEGVIVLRPGDTLLLTRSLDPGRAGEHDEHGRLLFPARIGCTLAQVFADVRVGESIWFDDGKIGAVVRAGDVDQLTLEIVQAQPDGDKLRADKGINLPDSQLDLPALTERDREDLKFVAQHADIVALSFVHRPQDVVELIACLAELERPDMGIVLKIETRRGFEQLPNLLLSTMQRPCNGVMIARGDLAVECGWERLAEIQEEILWICEAAHMPVIWATQVLESLAKTGRPSRAEITDAAMSERAECVMLNKGPHLGEALSVLDDILRRMQAHQDKKSAMLRPLRLARGY